MIFFIIGWFSLGLLGLAIGSYSDGYITPRLLLIGLLMSIAGPIFLLSIMIIIVADSDIMNRRYTFREKK